MTRYRVGDKRSRAYALAKEHFPAAVHGGRPTKTHKLDIFKRPCRVKGVLATPRDDLGTSVIELKSFLLPRRLVKYGSESRAISTAFVSRCTACGIPLEGS